MDLQNQSLVLLLRQVSNLNVQASAGKGGTKVGTPRAPRKDAGGADPESKIKNKMLYCRNKYLNDPAFREKCRSPDQSTGYNRESLEAAFNNDISCASLAKDTEKRYSAEFRIIWKAALTDAQKEAIGAEYNTWKATRESQSMPPPLGVENGMAGNATGGLAAPPSAAYATGGAAGYSPAAAHPAPAASAAWPSAPGPATNLNSLDSLLAPAAPAAPTDLAAQGYPEPEF